MDWSVAFLIGVAGYLGFSLFVAGLWALYNMCGAVRTKLFALRAVLVSAKEWQDATADYINNDNDWNEESRLVTNLENAEDKLFDAIDAANDVGVPFC